ncbi:MULTISPECIES: PilW family protein [Chromohalobacter]|uniref:PilW family protein n=1 Tax=Chromohalobacter TaxID=42054 RepID=UPI0015C49802|nr:MULTISPECIES: PilW family protein [Chromohalobacter]MDO0947301.1 PilW family protein [Chromohalobacter salexigens]NQY47359.1 PilW family protein [Chromohalobacter sp.]
MSTACKRVSERGSSGGGRRQHGVSLVELMVSLAIGMLVLVGVVDLFLAYQHQYRMQTQLAQMQESGRFVTDVLTRELRKAGYAPRGLTEAFPATAHFAAKASVTGSNDSIQVRYYGSADGTMQDCLGARLGRGDASRARFALREDGGLTCAVDDTPPQPLDALVVDLALRYFVADGWRRAAQVNDWTKVTGVSAELLVASPQDGLVDTASSYVFDGERVTAPDHRLYRVYTTAVALRNALHPHEEGAS